MAFKWKMSLNDKSDESTVNVACYQVNLELINAKRAIVGLIQIEHLYQVISLSINEW